VALTDQLWAQMKPLYEQLHFYVRAKLHQHYGAASTLANWPDSAIRSA
jgi:peptidyl-dipeptidase A